MARIILESSPVPFHAEILKADLREDIEIAGGEAVRPLMRVRGLFQRYEEKNANNRIYPKELFDRCLNEEVWKTRLAENSVIGLLEHPEDGVTRLTGPISHIVNKAWDKGDGEIWGEATILNTPDGRKVGALLEAKVPVGISSRGEGEVEEAMGEGVQRVIPESFNLITFDFVADNSVTGARVSPITGENKSSKSTRKESVENPAPIEYLIPTTKSPMANKNLIGEMRKAGVALKRLTSVSAKKLDFQSKVGALEELDELRGQISTMMSEDRSVEAYGKRLLQEMDDFESGFEDKASEPTDGGSNLPPGVGDEGGDDVGGDAAKPNVDQGAFDQVLKAVLKGMNPECADADLSGAYQEFCDTGSVDVHGLISKCSKGAEGGDSFNGEAPIGGEEEGGFEDKDFGDKEAFESKELRAAVELIAHLRESAQGGERYRQFCEELKERIRVHHPLLKELEEARKKLATMEGSSEWQARVERNKALLARAKEEISNLQGALEEEKQMTAGLVQLLKEHNVKDAKKLAEGDPEFFKKLLAKKKEEKDKKGGEKKDAKKDKDESKVNEEGGGLELGKGEKETRVGKAPTSSVTTSDTKDLEGIPDGECDDEGEKAKVKKDTGEEGIELATGEPSKLGGKEGEKRVGGGKSESKKKVEESKKEEEHDLLRIMNRHRSNPFSQM